MTDFARGVTSLYEETLTKMKANKKASKLKSNTLKTDTLITDTNQGKCTSLQAYGTLRDPRELKAKRSKSVGEFDTLTGVRCKIENNEYSQQIKNNEYSQEI